MNKRLEDIVKEAITRGIPVVDVELVNDSLAFVLSGFSKSGTALVYEKDGKIYSETRYNTINEINGFVDLAKVAFDWNKAYISREPFTSYDSNWEPSFKEFGWL